MMEKVNDGLYYDERSAGGIVYKQENGRIYWLVIKTLSKRFNRLGVNNKKEVYKFPKGHLLDNEVLKIAALREVEEEGRVKSRIISKIGSNDYIIWDKIKKKKIVKKVTFFLMEYIGDSSLKYYDEEVVLERLWLADNEAAKILTFDSEKILLRKAKQKLEGLVKI